MVDNSFASILAEQETPETKQSDNSFATILAESQAPATPEQKPNMIDQFKGLFKQAKTEMVKLKNTAPVATITPDSVKIDETMTGDGLETSILNQYTNELTPTENTIYLERTQGNGVDLNKNLKVAQSIVKDREKFFDPNAVKAGVKKAGKMIGDVVATGAEEATKAITQAPDNIISQKGADIGNIIKSLWQKKKETPYDPTMTQITKPTQTTSAMPALEQRIAQENYFTKKDGKWISKAQSPEETVAGFVSWASPETLALSSMAKGETAKETVSSLADYAILSGAIKVGEKAIYEPFVQKFIKGRKLTAVPGETITPEGMNIKITKQEYIDLAKKVVNNPKPNQIDLELLQDVNSAIVKQHKVRNPYAVFENTDAVYINKPYPKEIKAEIVKQEPIIARQPGEGIMPVTPKVEPVKPEVAVPPSPVKTVKPEAVASVKQPDIEVKMQELGVSKEELNLAKKTLQAETMPERTGSVFAQVKEHIGKGQVIKTPVGADGKVIEEYAELVKAYPMLFSKTKGVGLDKVVQGMNEATGTSYTEDSIRQTLTQESLNNQEIQDATDSDALDYITSMRKKQEMELPAEAETARQAVLAEQELSKAAEQAPKAFELTQETNALESNQELVAARSNQIQKANMNEYANEVMQRGAQQELLTAEQAPLLADAGVISVQKDLMDGLIEANKQVAEIQREPIMPVGLSIKRVKPTPSEPIEVPPEQAPYFKELDKNRGIEVNFVKKALQRIIDEYHFSTRTYRNLDPKKYGWLINELNQLNNLRGYGHNQAIRLIENIVKDLNVDQYKILSDKIILPDLLEDIKIGLYNDKELPFFSKIMAEQGLTPTDTESQIKVLSEMIETLDKYIEKDPVVAKALAERKKMIDNYSKLMVQLKILDKDAIKNNYFHHQVLQYQDGSLDKRTGKISARTPTYAFEKNRSGSDLAYNTDFIESEAAVLADMMTKIRSIIILQEIKGNYDISPTVKLEYKKYLEANDTNLLPEMIDPESSDLVPDFKNNTKGLSFKQFIKKHYPGMEQWQPVRGFDFYINEMVADKKLVAILLESGGITQDQWDKVIRSGLVLKGPKPAWIVPSEVAETLEKMQDMVRLESLEAFHHKITTLWKINILQNPYGKAVYDSKNLASDFNRGISVVPEAIPYIKQAIPTAIDAAKSIFKTEKLHRLAQIGFFSSNLEAVDTGTRRFLASVKKQSVGGKVLAPFRSYYDAAAKVSSGRENILRYATFLYIEKQLQKNGFKNMKYYASDKAEINDMISKGSDYVDIAAKQATEIYGDYLNVPGRIKMLAKYVHPFIRWDYINFRTTKRTVINEKWRALKYLIVPAMIALYHRTVWREADDEIRRTRAVQGSYLIIGHNKEENIVRFISTGGLIEDILKWLSLDDGAEDFQQILAGKKKLSTQWQEMFLTEGGANQIVQKLSPWIKVPFELFAGKSLFPSVSRGAPIRDVPHYMAKQLRMDSPYAKFYKIPTKDKGKWVTDISKRVDLNEANYFYVLNMIRQFNDRKGLETPKMYSTKEMNFAYFWKKAAMYDDKAAMDNYAQKYVDEWNKKNMPNKEQYLTKDKAPGLILGGRVLTNMHPINSLPKGFQVKEFLDTISPEDKKRFDQAGDYAIGNIQNLAKKVYNQ